MDKWNVKRQQDVLGASVIFRGEIMSSNTNSISVGFDSLLALLFIALKLTHYIAWSWWWVLSPIWIPFGIFAMFTLGALIIAFLIYVFD